MTVQLSVLSAHDIDALYLAVRESIADLSRWLPWAHADYDRDDAALWVKFCEGCWLRGSEFPMGVFDEQGNLLGGVGLSKVDRATKSANLGYWIRSAAVGNGVATAAARQISEYAFAELGFERLEIVVLPDNNASIRVAQKLGAVDDGLIPGRIEWSGEWVTARVFSLKREPETL